MIWKGVTELLGSHFEGLAVVKKVLNLNALELR